MAVFTLTTFRTNLSLILSNSASQWSSDEQDRAVLQAISAMSRYFPREVIFQTVFDEDKTDTPTLVSNTAVSVGSKPIRFGSETVTQSSVDFTKDVDYEMDYVNGTIKMLSTGGLSAASATVVYKLDGTMLDIASALTAPIAIDRVDVARSDQVPTIFESWAVHGDFLMITSGDGSQSRFVDNDHIRIYYLAQHTDPDADNASSYPDFLDELVLIGAAGYTLMIEVFQREHQAVTDLASARVALVAIAAAHTSMGTTFTSLQTPRGDINTALDLAALRSAEATALITSASAEAAFATLQLDFVDAANGPIPDADTALTAANSALDDVGAALTKVEVHVGASSGSAEEALNLIKAQLDKIDTQATSSLAEILTATENATKYLGDGDAFFNALNNSPDVPGDFRRYAEVKVQMAQIINQVGTLRAAEATARVSEARGRIEQANAFINEAATRLTHCQAELAIATTQLAVGDRFIATAAGFISNANSYTSQASVKVNQGLEYVREAEQRVAEVGTYLGTLARYVDEINAFLGEADRYHRSANAEIAIATTMRRDATDYLQSYFRALRDRAQIGTHPRASSVNQYASDNQGGQHLAWERHGTF